MSAVLSAPTSHTPFQRAAQTPLRPSNESIEEALRSLRDFLSNISTNAKAGDFHSAGLSLSALGEPPKQHETITAQQTINTGNDQQNLSPINLVVLKMRSARLAREQRIRQQQSKDSWPSATPIPTIETLYNIPEVYTVSPKDPRTLREQAILYVWGQARLKRWWAWHDAQMELLKEDKLQKQRRRQFLSNLRTHPWMKNETKEAPEEIKRRKQRAQLLSKLRTAPVNDIPKPSPSPRTNAEIEQALAQRKDSLKKLRPRTPSSPAIPKAFELPLPSHLTLVYRTVEDHRKALAGKHMGSLKRPVEDFWIKWAAQETLVEQRHVIRTHMDDMLSYSPPDITQRPKTMTRITAKRPYLDDDIAW